jgi:hypothetical protein
VNPNEARLTRIYTQKANTGVASVEDLTPIGGTSGNATNFEVVVEGEAGNVLGNSAQPYTLTLSAIDLTDVRNPNGGGNDFTITVNEAFNGTSGWPLYRKVFNVQLNDVGAVRDDLIKYFAVLNSQNEVDSSVESDVFTLSQ